MKEQNVLNVLMYLFHHHMQENCQLDTVEDELVDQLEAAGFRKPAIISAFGWLANLARESNHLSNPPSKHAFRAYSSYECEYLDAECRGFIMQLEQQGILNAAAREMVIAQALNLGLEAIDVSLIKWVTLMVLFNHPESNEALTAMELLVLDDTYSIIH